MYNLGVENQIYHEENKIPYWGGEGSTEVQKRVRSDYNMDIQMPTLLYRLQVSHILEGRGNCEQVLLHMSACAGLMPDTDHFYMLYMLFGKLESEQEQLHSNYMQKNCVVLWHRLMLHFALPWLPLPTLHAIVTSYLWSTYPLMFYLHMKILHPTANACGLGPLKVYRTMDQSS